MSSSKPVRVDVFMGTDESPQWHYEMRYVSFCNVTDRIQCIQMAKFLWSSLPKYLVLYFYIAPHPISSLSSTKSQSRLKLYKQWQCWAKEWYIYYPPPPNVTPGIFSFSNFPTPLPNLLYFTLQRCLYRLGPLLLNPFPSYLYLYYSSLLFRLLLPP